MGKKNEFVITIGFNKNDEDHRRVARLLNEMNRTKAQYIVKAVLAYEALYQERQPDQMNVVDYDRIQEYIRKTVDDYLRLGNENTSAKLFGKEIESVVVNDADIEEEEWGDVLSSLKSFRNS